MGHADEMYQVLLAQHKAEKIYQNKPQQVELLCDKMIEENLLRDEPAIVADIVVWAGEKLGYIGLDPDKRLVELDTGLQAEAAIREYVKNRPHIHPIGPASDLAAAAFGERPSLAARAKFLQTECGGDVALLEREAARWSTSLSSLKPGTRPASPLDPKDPHAALSPEAKKRLTNPWNENTPANIARRVDIISKLGTKAAAGMAKACGVSISGAPLRKVAPF